MNQVLFTGNLGRDAELRFTPTGRQVANFSLAVNERYKDAQGELQKRTVWVNIAAWGKQAEFANVYLRKGMKVLVIGRLEAPHTWDDNGTAKASNQVTAQRIEVMKWNDKPNVTDEAGPDEDDVPF